MRARRECEALLVSYGLFDGVVISRRLGHARDGPILVFCKNLLTQTRSQDTYAHYGTIRCLHSVDIGSRYGESAPSQAGGGCCRDKSVSRRHHVG